MLEKIQEIAKEKHQIDLTRNSWYEGMKTYLENIKGEIPEVEEELKENNQVHLEDELGDILWTYLLLIEGLEKKGMISGLDKIIARTEIKYGERINHIKHAPDDHSKSQAWKEIKAIQKVRLKEEHNILYNSKLGEK